MVEKCNCPKCEAARKLKTSEAEMHSFVGNNLSNMKCNLIEFENGLHYTNVLHWDVGYNGNARYYVYRNDGGELLGWYDSINQIGYKPTV